MGKTRNEKKTRKGLSSNIQSYTNNGEYDLESNFRKIRPYTQRSRKKNPPHGVTDSSEDFSRKRYQENYVDSSAPTSLQTASGSAFGIPIVDSMIRFLIIKKRMRSHIQTSDRN